MLSPPVPFALVKSPPWHMNPGMTRWKHDPSNARLTPSSVTPASPTQSALKFSAVLGTWFPYRPNSTRPARSPLMSISKKTLFVTVTSPGSGRSDSSRNSHGSYACSFSRMSVRRSSSLSQ